LTGFAREFERVTCPGCERTISAYVPHCGDGAGLRVIPHNITKNGRLCGHARCSVSGRIIVRDRGHWRLDP
jgi:hypothetical protein